MTIFRVPVIVTLAPGNLKAEGLHEVGECPGYQDVVVDPNVDRQHHHAIADPLIKILTNMETWLILPSKRGHSFQTLMGP